VSQRLLYLIFVRLCGWLVLLGRRNRTAAALSGAALLAASAATRWAVFHAGLASARDPKYTIIPQRERLRRQDRPSIQPS
jgi:hypothetical protein